MSNLIKKVLIANRGEIAIRTAEFLSDNEIDVVAVYAADDFNPVLNSLSAQYLPLGQGALEKTYLNRYKLLKIAQETKCDAVYPGYGLLSEDGDFAKLVEAIGLIYIGPSPQNLYDVGNKYQTIQLARGVGLPTACIFNKTFDNVMELDKKLNGKDYPVILKSLNGGGGKGIRIVQSKQDLMSAWNNAVKESRLSFGNSNMEFYVERFLTNVKHIEIQIARDQYGHVICFPERDCSLQFNQQKMIEESPCRLINSFIRTRLQEYAKRIVDALNYVNVGTVEFLVDSLGNAFFLEINGRIQVEYPVSEIVTGMNLLSIQFLIADGRSIKAKFLKPKSSAIECRLESINPNTFIPSVGIIKDMYLPGNGEVVRIDDSLFLNKKTSIFYDSLQAKIICSSISRDKCLSVLRRVLNEIYIVGLETNLSVLKQFLCNRKLNEGNYTISTLDKWVREKKHAN